MQIVAWIAAALVFATFFMRTIVPLRLLAIVSNIVFITYGLLGLHYGIFDKVLPILVLHVSLLPLNFLRLREVRQAISTVRHAPDSPPNFEGLIPFMKREQFEAGEYLFRRGDLADRMFLLMRGKARLIELDKVLEPGAIIGEVGIFAENAARTGSIRCDENCDFYTLTADKALELFYQNSHFGFFIVRSLARYVSEGINRASPAPLLPGNSPK